MKLKLCIAAWLLLCVQYRLQAQHKKALNIGDQCPDISFHTLNSAKQATLSHYKNKIIILDFFSVICGACIGSLPHLNDLQRENANTLQIILVANEPENTTKAFFASNSIAKKNELPVIVNNKDLGKLFPHVLLPHDVWIDRSGKISAITGGDAVVQDNITALANNLELNLPVKEDLLSFDASKPLFDSGNGGSTGKIFFRSTFSKEINGVKSKTAIYISNAGKRFLCLNQSLPGLYQEALNGIASNRILLQIKNEAAATALYCYELVVPPGAGVNAMHEMLQQDIERCFNIKGSYRQQLMHCYKLLYKTNDSIIPDDADKQIFFAEDSVAFSKPVSLAALTAALNDASKNASTIFFTGNDDMNLPAGISVNLSKVHTAADLQRQLLPYGISLMPVQQLLNMFVVTDADTTGTIVQNQINTVK